MDDSLWTVQDILAERRMANGESEVLVVWKPSWIPKSNMNDDGAVMRAFKEAMKVRFNSIYSGTGLGTLILLCRPYGSGKRLSIWLRLTMVFEGQ